ncbi:MAG TPA: hypothetical protein VIG05_04015 [Candidatus Nitrosotenuis sp.]|jgi:exopolyphosphatase/guanosine-5'-triphosphate,3'-diphosphate pyrophosphatase
MITRMQKISVIDLGSNSVKLVNFRINHDNSYQAYQQEAITVKLAEGLIQTDNLKEEPIRRTIEALKLFREIIDTQAIKHVLPVATSAVRDAANKIEFLDRIYFETGFRFRTLSEEEEALYSYAGTTRSLRIPTALFFDLGGGSLEMVYAEQYRIKKIISLPLGALRLTQTFADESGKISEKNYEKMKSCINKYLPEKQTLKIDDSCVLVGVGGTLRSIAKYNQEITKYPLNKIHNYKMMAKSVHVINERFSSLKPTKITKISSISSNRADTITAGACLIDLLMQRLGFDEVIVSAQGLREGTILMSLEHPKEFAAGKINQQHVEASVGFSYEPDTIPSHLEDIVRFLTSYGHMNEQERLMLALALRQVSHSLTFQNLINFAYYGMDVDSSLSHRQQLISILAIIYAKKKKTMDKVFDKFSSILQESDKKPIKKIASLISFSEVLEKSNAKIKLKSMDGNVIKIRAYPQKTTFPTLLFKEECDKLSNAFNTEIEYFIDNSKFKSQSLEVQ